LSIPENQDVLHADAAEIAPIVLLLACMGTEIYKKTGGVVKITAPFLF
jgi:hypothetical protein